MPDEPEIPLDASDIYGQIWEKFKNLRKQGKGKAWSSLQAEFCLHAAELVPHYMTAKEHMAMIAEIENYVAGDEHGSSQDPIEWTSRFLRGEVEISGLEKKGRTQ